MEPVSELPATGPAPYGQACTNCARAKCKCITRVGGSCNRCHRLGKECTPLASVRKRNGRRLASSTSGRRSQLEDKLDDLVSLLRAQHSTNPTLSAHGDSHISGISPPSTQPGLHCQLNDATSRMQGELSSGSSTFDAQVLTPAPTISASLASISNDSPPRFDGHSPDVSAAEAERYLATFRTRHSQFMPFLPFLATTTAEELQRERPFLWLNILAICTKLPGQQAELGARIREILAKQVLIEANRSLDLFLGTLTYLTWSHFFPQGKPHLYMISSVAWTLAFDLRINRPPDDESYFGAGCTKLFAFPKPLASKPRTNEERRALLACFVASSAISSMLRHDPARWSSTTDEAAFKLSEDRESPGDDLLVAVARITRIADDVGVLARLTTENPQSTGIGAFQVKALLDALLLVKGTLSVELLQNISILSHLYNTEVAIYALVLSHHPSPSPSAAYQPLDLVRLDHLRACVHAAKRCLDNFMTFDASQYLEFPFSVMMHFSYCISVLHRLSLLEEPGWDRAAVRSTADVLDYMEHIVTKVEQAHELGKLVHRDSDGFAFAKGVENLRKTVSLWTSALGKAHEGPTDATTGGIMDETIDPLIMDVMDDSWITDIFSAWD